MQWWQKPGIQRINDNEYSFRDEGAINLRGTSTGYNLPMSNTSANSILMYGDFQMKLFRIQYLIVIYWVLQPWEFFFLVDQEYSLVQRMQLKISRQG